MDSITEFKIEIKPQNFLWKEEIREDRGPTDDGRENQIPE